MNLKMDTKRPLIVTVVGCEKLRLDQILVSGLDRGFSRTLCQKLIKQGCVSVNGIIVKRPCELIAQGSALSVALPEEPTAIPEQQALCRLEDFAVGIIYENDDFVIINKPAGLLVHEASTALGEPTLVDWIRMKFPGVGADNVGMRPGIIHRLDRDTSGLMVIAKTPQAYMHFSLLFKNRLIKKCYHAVVQGVPPASGTIDWNIVRHPRNRVLMTHSRTKGREAITHYHVIQFFKEAALLELFPETGRTHQIRVHCAAIGRPIVGDHLYYKSSLLMKRQALHAAGISFDYAGQSYSFKCPYPRDMQVLVDKLSSDL